MAPSAWDPEVAPPFWKALLDRYLGPAREELGDDAGPAWEEGRQLSFEEAVERHSTCGSAETKPG
jgi:hypothetical protein